MTRKSKSPKGLVERYSVSLSPEASTKLDAYCKRRDRGPSWVFEKLVVLYLEKLP
jgi:hypothetical protein